MYCTLSEMLRDDKNRGEFRNRGKGDRRRLFTIQLGFGPSLALSDYTANFSARKMTLLSFLSFFLSLGGRGNPKAADEANFCT